MEAIEEKTFLDICWAAIIRKTLGWNKDYDELMQKKGFLEKLRERPEELFPDEIKKNLLEFLNKWGCRIRKEKHDTVAQELNNIFSECRDSFSSGGNILTFNFSQHEEKLNELLKRLGNIDEIGPTTISKILHVVNPYLFVMWDIKIAEELNFKHSEKEYLKFLQKMQKFAKNIDETYRAHKIYSPGKSLEKFLNEWLGSKTEYTLTKFIDEYNWSKYTKKWVLPSDWNKDGEKIFKKLYCNK